MKTRAAYYAVKEPKTTLQWLAPELVKGRFIRGEEPWIRQAAFEVGELFPPKTATVGDAFATSALNTAATLMAVIAPYAIDYIKQAPVLVLVAAMNRQMDRTAERLQLATEWLGVISRHRKLRDVMASYGVAYPLRKLMAATLSPRHAALMRHLRAVDASTLAQSIPHDYTRQRLWLDGLQTWLEVMTAIPQINLAMLDQPVLPTWLYPIHLDWLCRNIGENVPTRVHDLADFAANTHDTFNTRWTWDEAERREREWHAAMRTEQARAAFAKNYPFPFDQRIDFDDGCPNEATVDGLTFVRLRSALDCFEDGQEMHHCVAVYASRMAKGDSKLYSIRYNGNRLATMEMIPAYSVAPGTYSIAHIPATVTELRITQIKAHCNAAPDPDVHNAAAMFVIKVNAAIAKKFRPETPAASATPKPRRRAASA